MPCQELGPGQGVGNGKLPGRRPGVVAQALVYCAPDDLMPWLAFFIISA